MCMQKKGITGEDTGRKNERHKNTIKQPQDAIRNPGRTGDRPPWYCAMGERIPEEEIRKKIYMSPELASRFEALTPERQKHFLDMCSGAVGMMICYDPFFKYVFNPVTHRERLSRFLSCILERQVRVESVLPNEGGRIAPGSPFVIMDIVVELEDRALANAEIQKIGYLFPGERAACYSSDLVLRQYSALKENISGLSLYRQMRNVYTIVIMEESPKEFHHYPETYIHRRKQMFDTGLKMPLLQEYIFVPLDIFRKKFQNENIKTELEAWLGFLAYDDLERIWEISRYAPVFEEMYHDLSEFRRKPGEVLGMFSEALLRMDEAEARYYVDQLRKESEALKAELASNKAALESSRAELASNQMELASNQVKLASSQAELASSQAELASSQAELASKDATIAELRRELEALRTASQH